MAQLPGFNPQAAAAAGEAGGDDFTPLPDGWYNASVMKSEIKQTNAGDGTMLKLEFVLDGSDGPGFKGRKVWTNLNLINKSAKAVAIANRDRAALCAAVGLPPDIGDSEQLHYKPLQIHVKVKPASGQYKAGNEVKGYRALGAQPAGAVEEAAPAQLQGDPPPW